MRFRLFIILLITSFPLHIKQALSQSISQIQNVKVSQLSDEQIRQAWQKLQESGMEEEEAYKQLQQKGMAPIEIDLFKKRVAALGLNRKKSTPPSNPNKPEINFSRDTVVTAEKPKPVAPEPATEPVLKVYGTEFFNQNAIKFEPNLNIATPKGYVLGPGDELIILLTGMNESTVRTKISPEGNLQIPYAGIVYLNGFTIEQATSLIRKKMAAIYPALTSGQSQLTVNLGNTRSIRVTILGEVKTPGTYTISSLATLFNALHLSGGPTANGSLRSIELIRNNRVNKTVDFYTFLQKGLLEGNIRLEDQDVIRIPVYRKRVTISGEVKNPAIYELKGNESLSELIRFAGGYTELAYRGMAKVEQITEIEREVKDVASSQLEDFVPRNGDVVRIGTINNRFSNRVILEGAVNRPGIYELSAGLSLATLIQKAAGLKPEAYLERGYIKRTLPNLDKELISFSPADVINGRHDVPLFREDSVMIEDRSTFINDRHVTVNGNVHRPGTFTFRKGMKLADLVTMAGGFTEDAAAHHIEISRIIRNESDSVANQLVQSITVDLENDQQNIEIQPLDYIYIPRLVNSKTLGNVSVTGEVRFPGEYAVQKRDETAQDFLARAGGISPYGSLENAQVFRKGVRVNLDLTQPASNEARKTNMILLPGDSIYVPRVVSYVEVSGAVNNPQFVSYKGRRFKYYINASGGATENARIKGSYVQYPNGLNKPVRNFLFFRNYPAVKPGSKIIVPEKEAGARFRLGFGEISGITSAITALIGLIAILNK